MKHINIEIKAKSSKNDKIRGILQSKNADFKGIDHQIDTYFNVNHGRMKLREETIENHLIHYHRQNQKGPKQADIILYKPQPDSSLKKLLTEALGIWKIVDKKREIYFIDNVKFHLDEVKSLGTFMEIEAIDENGTIGIKKLRKQCNHYLDLFDIQQNELISNSYSDMVENQ